MLIAKKIAMIFHLKKKDVYIRQEVYINPNYASIVQTSALTKLILSKK